MQMKEIRHPECLSRGTWKTHPHSLWQTEFYYLRNALESSAAERYTAEHLKRTPHFSETEGSQKETISLQSDGQRGAAWLAGMSPSHSRWGHTSPSFPYFLPPPTQSFPHRLSCSLQLWPCVGLVKWITDTVAICHRLNTYDLPCQVITSGKIKKKYIIYYHSHSTVRRGYFLS